jgi:hypothetical protein
MHDLCFSKWSAGKPRLSVNWVAQGRAAVRTRGVVNPEAPARFYETPGEIPGTYSLKIGILTSESANLVGSIGCSFAHRSWGSRDDRALCRAIKMKDRLRRAPPVLRLDCTTFPMHSCE